MRTLTIEPLTKEAFAPFGDVIETDGSDHFMINNGSTMRFHKLATVETATPEDNAIISIFRADAQDMPLTVRMLERHPLGSQAFIGLLGQALPGLLAHAVETRQEVARFGRLVQQHPPARVQVQPVGGGRCGLGLDRRRGGQGAPLGAQNSHPEVAVLRAYHGRVPAQRQLALQRVQRLAPGQQQHAARVEDVHWQGPVDSHAGQ